MPALTTLLLFALATLIQTATPGPGILYLAARSLVQGRRAGFASMFGIESGEIVWLAAAATGLVALLASSVSVLTVLRFAGAAYLIFLGIQRWRASEVLVMPRPTRLSGIFAQGFVTQILNPKVALFFIAFLPQFVNPAQPIPAQVAILGAVYMAVAMTVDSTYVLTAAALARRFIRSKLAERRMGRASAATYVALGLAAAASGVKR